MIGAKNIFSIRIQFCPALHSIRKEAKDEHKLRPPAVKYAYQLKLFGERNGDQQQWKKN